MGAQSSVRKQLAAGAAGLVAMVLAGASFAWACTSGIETLAPNPRTAPPGATVTVEGTFWDRGVVHIYLAPTGSTGNRVELTSVAVTNMREHKSFSTQVTVPALAPGFYRMGASLTHATGDQAGQTVESVVGTYLFRVLAQTPASNSNGTPAGTSSPGTPATGHPTAGTPTASNESAVNTANQPAPAADGSAPAVANTAPLPAPEAATPAPVSAATNAGGALLPTAPQGVLVRRQVAAAPSQGRLPELRRPRAGRDHLHRHRGEGPELRGEGPEVQDLEGPPGR
jgi:hypothetical protein